MAARRRVKAWLPQSRTISGTLMRQRRWRRNSQLPCAEAPCEWPVLNRRDTRLRGQEWPLRVEGGRSSRRAANGSTGGLADLWLFVTPTKGRAVCAQPHFCVTAVRAILKDLRWRYWSMAKLVFGMSQSLDGYVDHLEMQPGPALFRHFTEKVRDLTGSVYGRRVYELMRYWDEDC